MDSDNIDLELKRLEELAKDSAVGDTMYDKKSVIEKILEVGKHFQETSYVRDGEVVELEPRIEEMLCTLWDISVEEDVSMFYLEHGVLDIFIELFVNPNNRVKEIAAGVMANMVSHQKIFLKIIEKDIYLEKCIKLLEEKDSPTLIVVLRCLHSFGFNIFHILNSEKFLRKKEDVKHFLSRFLVFLSLERVVLNLGIIVASCTNKDVLLNASKFLSILSELWEESDERDKVSQHYAEEQFLVCLLEGMKESIGEDKTEKHFAVFLNIIYEKDADKDLFVNLSDKVITISSRLLKEHILQYSSVEETDLEFAFNLSYLIKVSLNSGGYVSLPKKLSATLKTVEGRLRDSEVEDNNENLVSVLKLITSSVSFLESVENDEDDDDSCSTTSQSSVANSPRTFGTPQTFTSPQTFDTPQL